MLEQVIDMGPNTVDTSSNDDDEFDIPDFLRNRRNL